MKRIIFAIAVIACSVAASAQRNATRISACTGVLYERG